MVISCLKRSYILKQPFENLVIYIQSSVHHKVLVLKVVYNSGLAGSKELKLLPICHFLHNGVGC